MSHHVPPKLVSPEALQQARLHPFSVEVLGEDEIMCLECGTCLSVLGPHLARHQLSGAAYKARWGYNRGQPLGSRRWVEKMRGASKGREIYLLAKPGRSIAGQHRAARPQTQERRRIDQAQGARRGKHPIRNPSVPKISVQQVIGLFKQGYSVPQVAALLGCSSSLVRKRLRAVGVRFRRPLAKGHVTRATIAELRSQGLGWREVAWKLQCSIGYAQRVASRTGGPPPAPPPLRPDITTEAVLREAAQGRSLAEVARRLKTHKKTVIARLKGILPPQPVAPPQTSHPAWRQDIPVESVVELRRQGLSMDAIAARLGCHRNTVSRRLTLAKEPPVRLVHRLGLPDEEIVSARQQGLTLVEMAKRFGCSEHTIVLRIQKLGLTGHPPTYFFRPDVTIEAVVKARRAGLRLREIAEQLHCSVTVVQARLKAARQHGIDISSSV